MVVSFQFIAALLLIAAAAHAGPGDSIRLATLRTLFPGMQITLDRGQKIDRAWPKKRTHGELYFPDALSNERVYSIIGPAMNKAEREASTDLATGKRSITRRLRFKLLPWPKESDGALLAVLQYDFADVNPAMDCVSIGLLARLQKSGGSLTVADQYLLETTHHTSIQSIRLLDLSGQGVTSLVVESNSGGAGSVGSDLHMFDLSQGRLTEILETESRLQQMDEEWSTQALDLSHTRQTHGQRFCFSKTALIEDGKWFHPPRVTHPCYARGGGVDADETQRRIEMLAPLR